MPYEIPECAGKPYRPSNGSEGEAFQEEFCDHCVHEEWRRTQRDGDKKCEILSRSFMYPATDPQYPKEWTHDFKGRPTCTAFIERD